MAKIIRNPEYDSRSKSFGAVDSKGHFIGARDKVYRGRLETVPDANYGSKKTIYQLYYLYNPISIQHSSTVDPGYAPAQLFNGDGSLGDASAFLQLQQSISFNLLFDRTYETWQADGSYLSQWGVLADIKVLYALLGMYTTFDSTGNATGVDADPSQIWQTTPTSVHMFRPCWAVFGPLLKYYGAITNAEIQYTHFTQAMVPNRATVSLSMQLIPKNLGKTYAQQEKQILASTRATHVNRGLFDG